MNLQRSAELMALNPYALCPCGSGKKIKFCCGDLAGEMEKVLRMVEGDQPAAAVRHLELLLKKYPRRGSLLDLKSNIEMQLGWDDQARATVLEYLAAEPQSAHAWARQSALLSFAGQLAEAEEALQRAVSYSEDPPYSSVLLLAIRILGRAFEAQEETIPAIAHFALYSDVSPPEDMEGEKELIRLSREEALPEMLKGPFKLYEKPANSAMENDFTAAVAAARRGQWRTAAEAFETLQSQAPEEPCVAYNLALLSGFLGEREEMISRLREYAAREPSEQDAVDALALAQYLAVEHDQDTLDARELTFEVEDLDRIVERRTGDRRTPRLDVPDGDKSRDGEGPPPQAVYYLLDREDPRDWSELDLEDVPRLLGSVELFGRETDRPPRAVVRITRDAEYDAKLATVRELFDLGGRDPISESDAIAVTALGNFAMYYSYLPPDVSHETRTRVFDQSRLTAILEIWPATPQKVLGDRAPAELAHDTSRTRDLKAAVLRAFETQIPRRIRARAQELWGRLGLEPLPEGVDPEGIAAERLSFLRVRRVDAAKLSDERLAKVTLNAALANATWTIAHVALEVVRRPQLHRQVNVYAVARAATSEALDYATAVAFLSAARERVAKEIVPAGLWTVLEFEAVLDNLEESRFAAIFQEVTEVARQDKVVAQAFVQALAERGMITQDGRMRIALPPRQAGPDRAEEPREEPAIWTPESEAAREGKGKIWLPS